MPAHLRHRFKLANIREGVAVIIVDSAATLTSLRFQQSTLLQELCKRSGLACLRLAIKVVPEEFTGYG
jgi:hypothetical protein